MIPIATAVELGIKLIGAGLAALQGHRETVAEEDFTAILAELQRHKDRWDQLFGS